jgi:UDP-N-acetylmuramoylalanine--D-glutamate ligase
VRTVNGVQYINDSIATAPERALAAMASFVEPVVLLAGGRDKAMEWDQWADVVRIRAKSVILFGDLGPMLEARLAQEQEEASGEAAIVRRVSTLEEAVRLAGRIARPGDVVLLSPGGTSYDAYADFAERGAHFRRLVAELAGES